MKPTETLNPLYRLLLWAWKDHTSFLRISALGMATMLSSMGLLTASAWIIASAALHPSIATLQVAIVGVRFFGISRSAFRYAERFFSHQWSFAIQAKWRVWLYKALLPIAPAHLSDHSGHLLSIMIRDMQTVEQFWTRAAYPPLVALGIACFTLSFLAFYSPWLALIQALGFAFAGLVLPWLAFKRAQKVDQGSDTLLGQWHADALDLFQGLPEALAFGLHQRYETQLIHWDQQWLRSKQRDAKLQAALNALASVWPYLSISISLFVLIPMVYHGALTGVQMTFLLLLSLSSYEAFLALPTAAQWAWKQSQAAQRIFDIVDRKPVVLDPSTPWPISTLQNHLSLSDLGFKYPNQWRWTFRHFNLSVSKGTQVHIVGESGRGKSTLAALLCRFWNPSEGMISWDQNPIDRFQSTALRRKITWVRQRVELFTGTVRENLLLANPLASDQDLWKACEAAQIADDIRAWPKQLDTEIGEAGKKLSGGQRQRLNLARALLLQPDLIVLDEVTANLSLDQAKLLVQNVQDLFEHKTLIWLSHQHEVMEALSHLHTVYFPTHSTQ